MHFGRGAMLLCGVLVCITVIGEHCGLFVRGGCPPMCGAGVKVSLGSGPVRPHGSLQ